MGRLGNRPAGRLVEQSPPPSIGPSLRLGEFVGQACATRGRARFIWRGGRGSGSGIWWGSTLGRESSACPRWAGMKKACERTLERKCVCISLFELQRRRKPAGPYYGDSPASTGPAASSPECLQHPERANPRLPFVQSPIFSRTSLKSFASALKASMMRGEK